MTTDSRAIHAEDRACSLAGEAPGEARGRGSVDCAVVVLNHNGEGLLPRCMESVLRAGEACSARCRAVVIDNQSTDGSLELLRTRFPDVTVVRRPNDYLFSYNGVIRSLEAKIVVALNNDVYLDDGFLEALLPHFGEPDVFAATGRILEWDTDRFALPLSRQAAKITAGWLKQYPQDMSTAGPTIYCIGAAVAYDREKFLELGGFDTLFRPHSFEDFDISYRAWKRGWRCLYEPRAVAWHKVAATIGRYYTDYPVFMKNWFLSQWVNMTDPWPLMTHIALLPGRLVKAALRRDAAYLSGFFMAAGQLPAVLRGRRTRPRVCGDREVLRRSSQGAAGPGIS